MTPARRVAAAVAVLAVCALIAMQLAARPTLTNPPLDAARSIAAHVDVPPDVNAILRRACYDCHSFETRWPLYSRVAPVSWIVADDVRTGRGDLNFSDWGTDPDVEPTPAQRLGGICHDVRRGIMPPASYVVMHPSARLSAREIDRLCAWAERERARLAR